MFLVNKYYNWYMSIIERAQARSLDSSIYTEKHHIIPKSLGGSNAKDNLVRLLPREHFVCHMLLPKIVENDESKYKMLWALWRMATVTPKSRSYAYARKAFAEAHSKHMTGVPKSKSHRKALMGKRPHVNQTGANNNASIGYYITPWGTYGSAREACDAAPINMSLKTLRKYCMKSHLLPVLANKKTKALNIKIGITYRDNGFYFVNKEAI